MKGKGKETASGMEGSFTSFVSGKLCIYVVVAGP
jgi:hypothetical protein